MSICDASKISGTSGFDISFSLILLVSIDVTMTSVWNPPINSDGFFIDCVQCNHIYTNTIVFGAK